MRRVTGAVSVWAVLYLLFVPLAAQETARGKVSGTVADSATRQAITGAVVTVSGTTLSASTNAGGYFVIENVPAGTHDLIVKRLGYRPATATAVTVAAGGTALDPEVVAQLITRRGPFGNLTPRELEVLSLMAEGRSNAGIAQSLVLTVGAVEKHIAGIFGKLRLPPTDSDNRRVLAVLAYLQQRD